MPIILSHDSEILINKQMGTNYISKELNINLYKTVLIMHSLNH